MAAPTRIQEPTSATLLTDDDVLIAYGEQLLQSLWRVRNGQRRLRAPRTSEPRWHGDSIDHAYERLNAGPSLRLLLKPCINDIRTALMGTERSSLLTGLTSQDGEVRGSLKQYLGSNYQSMQAYAGLHTALLLFPDDAQLIEHLAQQMGPSSYAQQWQVDQARAIIAAARRVSTSDNPDLVALHVRVEWERSLAQEIGSGGAHLSPLQALPTALAQQAQQIIERTLCALAIAGAHDMLNADDEHLRRERSEVFLLIEGFYAHALKALGYPDEQAVWKSWRLVCKPGLNSAADIVAGIDLMRVRRRHVALRSGSWAMLLEGAPLTSVDSLIYSSAPKAPAVQTGARLRHRLRHFRHLDERFLPRTSTELVARIDAFQADVHGSACSIISKNRP